MVVLALDHLQLAIPPGGETLARAFYGDLLGLAEIAKPESLAGRGGCWFALGAVQLHLGVESGFRPARKANPAFEVGDLAEMSARLVRADAPIEEAVALAGWSRLYTADPFGNRIELIQRVSG